MVSVAMLDSFLQCSNSSIYDGKTFNLCGVNLDTVREDNVEKKIDESRESLNTRWTAGERDDVEDTDDESSVVSSSGVSVLSIDYNNNDIVGLAKEKVDLSDIGDDESTVASFDSRIQNIDESAEISAAKQHLENPNSKASIPRNNSSTSKSSIGRSRSNISTKKIESKQVSGNPAAEEKRKDLLLMLRNNIATHGRYSIQVANMVYRLAEFHESVNQPEMSVTLYLEALNIYSSKLGDSDTTVTETQVRLGKLKEALSDYDSALDYYCKALSMITAMTGVYEENTSTVRLHVARIYQIKGFHKESVKELKKSLRAFRDLYGDEHTTVADTVDQIADVYSEGGNHDKANSVRGELVKLKVALHGSKCSEVAHSLTKWAGTFIAVGDNNGALKVMKQAYVMYHEVEGAEALSTESTLEQIGYLYSQSDREEKAIKAHTSVAVMRKIRHGEESVEVAKSYLTLGKSFIKCEQFDKAMKSLNRAMTIFGKENEANNSHIGSLMEALHHIGIVHKKSGKFHQALKAFTKELSIRKKMMKDDKIGIATTLAVVGGTHYDLKRNETAFEYFLESLDLFDKFEGRQLRFADVLFSCGDVLKQMNNPTSSKCYIEAIQIYKANGYGEEDSNVQQMLNQMSGIALSNIRNIEPSLKCAILDLAKRDRAGRIEI